jgi:hypothetical protein
MVSAHVDSIGYHERTIFHALVETLLKIEGIEFLRNNSTYIQN